MSHDGEVMDVCSQKNKKWSHSTPVITLKIIQSDFMKYRVNWKKAQPEIHCC